MAYVKTNWEDYPSTATAIDADALNHMEDGIADLDDRVVSLDGTVSNNVTEVEDARVGWDNTTYSTLQKSIMSQIKQALKSDNLDHISSTGEYEDCDTLPDNIITFFSSRQASTLAHLPQRYIDNPSSNFMGYVITIHYLGTTSSVNRGFTAQLLIDTGNSTATKNRMYFRTKYQTWGDWKEVGDSQAIIDIINALKATLIINDSSINTTGSYQTNCDDFDTLPVDQIIFYSGASASDVSHMPIDLFTGYVITHSYHGRANSNVNRSFSVQIATCCDGGMLGNGDVYVRAKYSTWGAWLKVETDLTRNFFEIFRNMVFIGDSLTKGAIYNSNLVGTDCPDSAWGAYLARENGADYHNFAVSGATSKSWLSTTAHANFVNSDAADCYFIAFGTNDYNSATYPLGDTSDVAGTDSFVGYMKQIIEEVRTKSPYGVIFLVSTYNPSVANGITYSAMIKTIAAQYTNCYYIDYINKGEVFTNSSNTAYATGGHFTAIGHMFVARMIKKLANVEVNAHITDLPFLPTHFQE